MRGGANYQGFGFTGQQGNVVIRPECWRYCRGMLIQRTQRDLKCKGLRIVPQTNRHATVCIRFHRLSCHMGLWQFR
jgi:hypothetical protein